VAYTKIWPVRDRLDRVNDYGTDAEKTRANQEHLQGVFTYATDTEKTEQQFYVTGVNCLASIATDEMLLTKERWNKPGGILAFHGIQSFEGHETTPEIAHAIGVEFARRMWGARFEVVVSTHLNTGNLHNHFVVNSISFRDGGRYHDNKATYYGQIRKHSDDVCREHGLPIIAPQGRGRHYTEQAAERSGRPTIRSQIRAELDEVIAQSFSLAMFFDHLRQRSYTVRRGPDIKHTSISPPYTEARFRLTEKSLGKDYTEDAIAERIVRARRGEVQTPEVPSAVLDISELVEDTPDPGIRALYHQYVSLLAQAGRQQLPPGIRGTARYAVIQIEKYKTQHAFMREHSITTRAQLDDYATKLDSLMSALADRRAGLYKDRRRGEDTGTEIEDITAHLRALRKDRRIIDAIVAKAPDAYAAVTALVEAQERARAYRRQRDLEEGRNRNRRYKR